MNIIFCIILTITASSLLLFFIVFLYLLLRIFTGKSITNPEYPPVNGTVFNQLLYFSRLYDYQTQVAKKQPTYRLLALTRSAIYTTDVRNVEHMVKSTFEKYSKGAYNLDLVSDLLGEGIFAVDGDHKWRQQRKLASFEFSTRVLRDYSCSVFRSYSAKLVKSTMELAVGGRDFDFQDIMMRFTLTSIFKVGFGVELDGSSKDGIELMKAFDDSNALVHWRHVDPFWKLKRFLNIGCEATLKKKIKVLDDFLYKIITQKRKLRSIQGDPSMVKEDILSRFLVESEKNPGLINDKYLRDIILNFMFAGKDTSAGTLSWFFYLLCKHPLVQEKIAEEVRRIGGDKRDDEIDVDDFVGSISDQVLERMHYLHAALTETLRLYPAVPVEGRCAMVDDILPNGHKVKKGDGVHYMAYAMGRMPYIWGEDAEEFRPERWLNNGTFQSESPFKFVAFHAGPQNCLGKEFAYRQMKIISIALLRFFRFKLANESKNVTYKPMITLHIAGGLNLRAFTRINT